MAEDLIEDARLSDVVVGDDLAEQEPQAFGRLRFRGIRREDEQLNASGNDEVGGDVPPGAIEYQDDPFAGPGCDLTREGGEHLGEHGRVDHGGQESGHLPGPRPRFTVR